MTLASASERIRGMEDALGVALFERSRRGVTPTPAGRSVVHHARLVLQQIDLMQGELGDFGAGLKGHVRLLCNTSALSEHLPQVLSRFLREHRGISVDLEERTSFEIVDALRSSRLRQHCGTEFSAGSEIAAQLADRRPRAPRCRSSSGRNDAAETTPPRRSRRKPVT